jgi:hypothetical protein
MFDENEFDYLYLGFFKHGQMHGYGIEVSRAENSDRLTEYRGFFFEGERHGVGMIIEYSSRFSKMKKNIPDLNISGSDLFLKLQPRKVSSSVSLRK